MNLQREGSFYGWYFKCQSDMGTMAVIPAVHGTGRGRTCSLQIITKEEAWTVTFPAKAYQRKGMRIAIGKNHFGDRGIRLSVRIPGLNAVGKLNFGPLTPLKYHIMGPFLLVPFLECCHSVWSMKHTVWGSVRINGKLYTFRGGEGYWEGDGGRSFPKEYLWTQCSFPEGALMLSVADIPLAGFHFQGVIGVVLWRGREYRLATYLGARVVRRQNGLIKVVQGDMELEAELLERIGKPLKAPVSGDMNRIIHESVACMTRYRFRKGKQIDLYVQTDKASFEYEYPD
jgi:hypothetical protein